MNVRATIFAIALTTLAASSSVSAALPDPGMEIDPERTAVLITDPQNDFLSPHKIYGPETNTVWTTEQAVQKISGNK